MIFVLVQQHMVFKHLPSWRSQSQVAARQADVDFTAALIAASKAAGRGAGSIYPLGPPATSDSCGGARGSSGGGGGQVKRYGVHGALTGAVATTAAIAAADDSAEMLGATDATAVLEQGEKDGLGFPRQKGGLNMHHQYLFSLITLAVVDTHSRATKNIPTSHARRHNKSAPFAAAPDPRACGTIGVAVRPRRARRLGARADGGRLVK